MGDIRCNPHRMGSPGFLAVLLFPTLLVAASASAGFDISSRIVPPDGAESDFFGFSLAAAGSAAVSSGAV